MRTVAALLFLEVLNPFYIFQIFSFVLWMLEEYYYYAACIIFMSLCSVIMAVIQTRRVHYSSIKITQMFFLKIGFINCIEFFYLAITSSTHLKLKVYNVVWVKFLDRSPQFYFNFRVCRLQLLWINYLQQIFFSYKQK